MIVVPDLISFSKKDLNKVEASDLQLSFNIF